MIEKCLSNVLIAGSNFDMEDQSSATEFGQQLTPRNNHNSFRGSFLDNLSLSMSQVGNSTALLSLADVTFSLSSS